MHGVIALLLHVHVHYTHSAEAHVVSPPSGVLDEVVAAGPVPALVMALTLKLYKAKGLKPDTSTKVVSAPCTEISREKSGLTTCILYPVMTPFRFSSRRGDHESSALVGRL